MKKYFHIFRMSIERETSYRFNFFLGRLRGIMVLILLYSVWKSLGSSGRFAGYSQEELFSYVLGAHLIRAWVFGAQSRMMAMEINEGIFSKYLAQPVNHFFLVYFRELGEKILALVVSFFEVGIFAWLTGIKLFFPAYYSWLPAMLAILILAHILYFVFSYTVSLIAIWSREAMGPRFLFEIFLEFASGSYFPLNIFNPILYSALSLLPFTYLIYFPMQIYLGRLDLVGLAWGLIFMLAWIAASGFIAKTVWSRALKRYTGEGI